MGMSLAIWCFRGAGSCRLRYTSTRIRRSVKGRGIHLKSFFTDYDSSILDSTDARFIRALNTALSQNFPMTAKKNKVFAVAIAGADSIWLTTKSFVTRSTSMYA